MRRVAYATAEACGRGHAVRGIALVQAGRRVGVEVRAFGPPRQDVREGEYEGSVDWMQRVIAFRPDLLLGDVAWRPLRRLRATLDIPAWLLVRAVRPGFMECCVGWDRIIAIEPAATGLPGITDHAAPVVVSQPRYVPVRGSECSAGYNLYWEASRFGFDVRWRDEPRQPERMARIGTTAERFDGAEEILVAAVDRVVYVFDPSIHGRDYKVADHGFRAVALDGLRRY